MIVLDTHIWLWWINNDVNQLGLRRKEKIDQSNQVAVSIMSCFEVAWLDCHQRIKLPCHRLEWFDKALTGSDIILLPLTLEIINCAIDLPEHHTDPQDRLIIATALENDAMLISADNKFKNYDELSGKLI